MSRGCFLWADDQVRPKGIVALHKETQPALQAVGEGTHRVHGRADAAESPRRSQKRQRKKFHQTHLIRHICGILRGAKGSRTRDLYNAIVRAADCSLLWDSLLWADSVLVGTQRVHGFRGRFDAQDRVEG